MLAATLLLLGTVLGPSAVIEAVTCRPNTIPYNGECLCLTNSAVDECTYTQDCSYMNGCECKRPECSCGSGYCKDIALCDALTGRCKCGNAGKLCLPEETCFLGMCICDKETIRICQGGTTCKSRQCYCGERVCGSEEVCVSWPTPYCACGNFPRMCESNEVCEFDGFNFHCKCGGKVCGTEERCEYHNGSYSCKCDGNVCDEHELCIKPYASDPPFCICGKKECEANERCGVFGTAKLCLCGTSVCRAPGICQPDGICIEPTSSVEATTCTGTISAAMTEINITSDCMSGDVLYNEYCYHFNTEKTDFGGSISLCRRHSGILVFIMSAAEQEFIDNHMRGHPYWTNLRRYCTGPWDNCTTKLSFTYGDAGLTVVYTNWDDGYPLDRQTDLWLDRNICIIGGMGELHNKWRNWDCDDASFATVCKYKEEGAWLRRCRVGDTFYGSCYHVGTEPRTFRKAQEICTEDYQGNLVSILSDWDQEKIDYYIALSGAPYWTGLLRRHVSVTSSITHEYQWLGSHIDASTVFTNWDRGYPVDNASSFDCVATRVKAGGRWRNMDCNTKLSYVCQY